MGKWKSLKLSKSKVLATFGRASRDQLSNGMAWYRNANNICQEIAEIYSQPVRSVVGVMAALSPSCSWEKNIENTITLLRGKRDGIVTYPANIRKAEKIARGRDPADVLGGRKVVSFFELILNPDNGHDVCIDRHAVKVVTRYRWLDEQESQRFLRSQYDRACDVFRTAAKKEGVLPHQMQAVTWLVQRGTDGHRG